MPGEEKKPGEAPKTRARKSTGETPPSAKATPDVVATIVQAIFYMYGQSRPAPIRHAWLFADDELEPVTVPGARLLNRLGGKALSTFMLVADPVALLMGVHAIIEEGKRRESTLFAEYIGQNPQAAAEFAEWERTRRNGNKQRGNTAPEDADFRGDKQNDLEIASNGTGEATGNLDATL